VIVLPRIFKVQSAGWQKALQEQLAFPPTRPIIVNGPNVHEPRDVLFFGLPQCASLHYGPLNRVPQPLPPVIEAILQAVQRLDYTTMLGRAPFHSNLNVVLVNHYHSGKDSMGYHADCYPGMGSDPFIVSLSLGSAKTFQLKSSSNGNKISLCVADGSLIIMLGYQIQQQWQHALPKDESLTAHWNLSFRHHLTILELENAQALHNTTNSTSWRSTLMHLNL
jgi:alkylated DNA repair dioxygenase AlkB